MNQKLYLECYAGISGDMTVAALLDLGADAGRLEQTLKSLSLDGYSIRISRVKKSGLDACDFDVLLDAEHENHDHDMSYLHGTAEAACADGVEHAHVHTHEDEHAHTHEHAHENEHVHTHEHVHEDGTVHTHEHVHEDGTVHTHEHVHENEHVHTHVHEDGTVHTHEHHPHEHHHAHAHRGLPEIMEILEHSEMTGHAKAIARRIFQILAEAEAKAHGVPIEQVHFHEVGAVDSIVDVAAVAICLDDLGIEDVIVPVLYEGTGYIRCQHGVIPVPVPATVNIVSAYHLRMHQTETMGEFVTPTGAAIAAAICTEQELPPCYTIEKIGLGAGKRNYERPSFLRAMIITPVERKKNGCRAEEHADCNHEVSETADSAVAAVPQDCILKLECNLDDCTGETIGYVMQQLFEAGARDVFYTPIYMKKNRPAYLVTVLCAPEDGAVMEEILFSQTSTIGVRRQKMERSVLLRENRTIETGAGMVDVKVILRSGTEWFAPEYESVAGIAGKTGTPFWKLYKQLEAELNFPTRA